MTDETKGKSQAQALYAQAEKKIREAHKEEFETILSGLYADAGLTRQRRLTADERAAAKQAAEREKARVALAKIKAQFPDLDTTAPEVGTVLSPPFTG